MEEVRNYGIMYHCYKLQGIFTNANRLAVRYANLKDTVHSFALGLSNYLNSIHYRDNLWLFMNKIVDRWTIWIVNL